jgi:hypothetical protein
MRSTHRTVHARTHTHVLVAGASVCMPPRHQQAGSRHVHRGAHRQKTQGWSHLAMHTHTHAWPQHMSHTQTHSYTHTSGAGPCSARGGECCADTGKVAGQQPAHMNDNTSGGRALSWMQQQARHTHTHTRARAHTHTHGQARAEACRRSTQPPGNGWRVLPGGWRRLASPRTEQSGACAERGSDCPMRSEPPRTTHTHTHRHRAERAHTRNERTHTHTTTRHEHVIRWPAHTWPASTSTLQQQAAFNTH